MNKKRKKLFLWVLLLLSLFVLGSGLYAYSKLFAPNVKNEAEIYLSTGSNYKNLLQALSENKVLKDSFAFIYTARLKKFRNKVYPGRYIIKKGMSNNDLVNMFRGGRQTPVRVTFNNIRTTEDFAGRIAAQIEADSAEIQNYITNEDTLKQYNFNKKTVLAAFIPDSYEFYWNTSAEEFFNRMIEEYQKFWTDKRKQKAAHINLSPVQVSVLASIVQAEQSAHDEEKPTVAGLYINRIERGMPLESDPTLIFAKGDFTIKRVLLKDKEIVSPYNTYLNTGLPPGPINMPEKSSIDAVLNYERHDYIFMCAKEDFSGYHYFSKSLRQHNIYRRKYQNAMNERNIYR